MTNNETYISTQQSPPQTHPRVQSAHGHEGRSGNPETSAIERTPPSDTVKTKGGETSTRLKPGTGLPRRQRLRDATDFSRVFKTGRRSTDDYFTVVGCSNELGYPRLGLAISRKYGGTAVRRNLIKRRVREAFRHGQEDLGAIDVVVIARAGLKCCERSAMQASLRHHWQNIQRLCAPSSSH